MSAISRLLGAGALIAIGMGLPGSVRADSTTSTIAFDGSAAAAGVRVKLSVPGFPLTDTPFDGGGPAAQVAVNTIGSSNSYASFPDPGPLVNSVPGVLTGLLGQGVAGLPPVKLPSLPAYPLSVSTDANTTPDKSLGAGPYGLSAHSATASGSAMATGGLQTGLLGNAALLASNASLTSTADGKVISTATSDLQGLTIGPLTLGEVKSTATEMLTADGKVTPSTSLQISGVQIAGLAVSLNGQGISVAGITVPLSVGATLERVLAASNLTVKLVAAQTFPDRVVSPAVEITVPFKMPFKVPSLGQFSGTTTLTIGSATASMTGAAAVATSGVDGSSSASAGAVGQSGGTVDTVPGGSGTFSPTPSGPLGGAGGAGAGLASGNAVPAAAPMVAAPRAPRPGRVIGAAPAGWLGQFDVRSMYLLLAVCGAAAGGLIQLIRLMGVRKPWTSGSG